MAGADAGHRLLRAKVQVPPHNLLAARARSGVRRFASELLHQRRTHDGSGLAELQ